jgi:hypothetical protein
VARSSNTTVSIGADTSALRADLAVAEARMKSFTQQMREAQKEFLKTGERSGIDKIAPQLDTAARSVSGLRKEVTALNQATDAATGGFRQFFREGGGTRKFIMQLEGGASTLEKMAASLGDVGAGFVGAFAGVAVVQAVTYMLSALDELSARITDIQNKSREMGQKPAMVQAFRDMAAEAGQAAEAGETMLSGLSKLIEKEAVAKPFQGPVQTLRGAPAPPGRPFGGPVLQSTASTADGAEDASKKLDQFAASATNAASASHMLQMTTGGFVTEFRGGKQAAIDLNDALKVINVDLSKFPNNAEGTIQKTKAVAQGFKNFAETMDKASPVLNAVSKALFSGVPAETALKTLPEDMKKLDERLTALQGKPRAITQEMIDLTAQLNQFRTEAEQSREDLMVPLQTAAMGFEVEFYKVLANIRGKAIPAFLAEVQSEMQQFWAGSDAAKLESDQQMFNQGLELWRAFISEVQQLWGDSDAAKLESDQQFFAQGLELWRGYFQSIQDLATQLFSWLAQKTGEVARAIRDGISQVTQGAAAGDPSIPAMPGGDFGGGGSPFASGGRVPGTGSGDSVRAWLTPGEFVNRRASVNYYGSGLFRALNARAIPRGAFSGFGFAAGGLVGSGLSLAGGGALATADGGGRAPVHLHIGGGEFALAGKINVVDRLVGEAGRQQRSSGGIKPSWYSGRPGGR